MFIIGVNISVAQSQIFALKGEHHLCIKTVLGTSLMSSFFYYFFWGGGGFQASDIGVHRRNTSLQGLPLFLCKDSEKLFRKCLVSTVGGSTFLDFWEGIGS